MNSVLIVILIIIVGLAAIIFIPQLLIRRAISQVIRIFRKLKATSPQTAKTQEELRLEPKSLVQRMMTTRDYKPQALDLLVNAKIIIMTDDGKYYLSEQALVDSPIGQKIKLPRY